MKFYKPSVDGLRTFAFICILIHHVELPGGGVFKVAVLDALLQKLNEFGWIGVDIFLCLSAYLLTKLLMIEYVKDNRISVKNFFVRRILRIFPLYYLYMILAFGVLPALGCVEPAAGDPGYETLVAKHLLPYLLLLGNWSVGIYGYPEGRILGHMWTISLEQQFYLVLPIILGWFVFSRKKQTAFLGLVSLFALTASLRFVAYYFSIPHPFIWVNTFTRLDPFIIGIAIALVPEKNLKDWVHHFPAGSLFILGLLFFFLVSLFPNVNQMTANLNWQYPLVALGSGLALLSVLQDEFWRRLFSLRPMVFVGKISYGCYVYHVLAIRIAEFSAKGLNHYSLTDSEVYFSKFSLSLLITLFFSAISYHYFEKKILLLKMKFTTIYSRPI